MCTGLTLGKNKHFAFGRNMDIEYSFGQQITIVPRNFEWTYKKVPASSKNYSMIGMAYIAGGYPLFADAMNEHGLCVAGLNFPGYAVYNETIKDDAVNLAPYEIIPWILANFKTVDEAYDSITKLNIIKVPFGPNLPLAPLHWMVSDKNRSLVIEQSSEGLKIYENHLGVLTNNPDFGWHVKNLSQFMSLNPKQVEDVEWNDTAIKAFGQGTGAIGLPGDFSPSSRFVKIAFLKEFSVIETDQVDEFINQFFHLLNSVAFVKGSVVTPQNKLDITAYTSCMLMGEGKYFYKTYNNSQINVIDLFQSNLDDNKLTLFDLLDQTNINKIN